MTALAPTLQAFFTDRLALQRQASGHTVAAYRDALRMLVVYAAQQVGRNPSRLDIADLDAQTVGAFLNHLENERGNSVRTRNARLAAIHSLFGYASVRHPEHAADIQRVLAIPPKRYDKALITYLAEDEITALLAAPDLTTWTGRRDQALLVLACQTGLRATELTTLTTGDVHLGTGAHVSCLGKGRKHRITPLTPATVTVLRSWLGERGGLPADPLFITRRGTQLSRDALERRIAKYTSTAAKTCPSLLEKKVSPHTLRHSKVICGTRMINRDVPQEVVRRILDHDSPQMTGHYARLSDTTIRRHWEKARKVNASGQAVTLDPGGPLAEAAWAKQRLSRATQALPNGYCGLPLVKQCPHANACLTCPMFITTAEFLPQHRAHRQQALQIISAAQTSGQTRLTEMNQQVASNLAKIITALEDDLSSAEPGEAADAS